MQKNVKKEMYYTMLIYNQIMEMFNEECDNYIDIDELVEDDNATRFIHALSCAASLVYEKLTHDGIDFLRFNHIANRLCFQFCGNKDTDKT